MSLSAGIIGLPNVGKSTLFNALSSAVADAENYPFCTIDPNVGVVSVPDERLETIKKHLDPEEAIPAAIEFYDIAGLVEGASKGEGLGNQFLSNIREVDALVHVIRCFEDDDVAHVEGSIDPVRDVEIVQTELILADLETVVGRLDKARRNARGDDREAEERVDVLEKAQGALEQGQPARTLDLSDHERELLHDSHLLTEKPVIYVGNVSEDGLKSKNVYVEELESRAEQEQARTLRICASLEEEIADLSRSEKELLLDDYDMKEPALNRLIRLTYEVLGLQSFFTIANEKLRAWPIPKGATAKEAAGIVHSDFEEHFIRAEVFTVEDLVEHGDPSSIREAGELRVKGKDYVVKDGDILKIRHDA